MTRFHSQKRGCSRSLIQNFDIYGEGVAFTFQKNARFSTWIGMVFTLLTLSFMIAFTVNRTTKLVSQEDPFFSMLAMAAEDSEVDLWELNFMFAVTKLDPRAGRVSAE